MTVPSVSVSAPSTVRLLSSPYPINLFTATAHQAEEYHHDVVVYPNHASTTSTTTTTTTTAATDPLLSLELESSWTTSDNNVMAKHVVELLSRITTNDNIIDDALIDDDHDQYEILPALNAHIPLVGSLPMLSSFPDLK
jgi:hypothetical protein